MAEYLTRYGYSGKVTLDNFSQVCRELLDELRTEEFEEPDDEHTQVALSNDIWAVTAMVSGLIILECMLDCDEKNYTEQTKYMRDISDESLVDIWRCLIAYEHETLLAKNWVDKQNLPEYQRDFYRQ